MMPPEPATRSWGSTVRIRAVVLVTGGRTVTGDLHLQSQASLHSGPETPEDALNRSEGFFPLTDDSGRTSILAKSQVLAVGIVAGLPEEDPDRRSAARLIALRVELSDGSDFTGTVTSELPPDRRRAMDFLNLSPEFFELASEGAVRLINRRHIRVATPLD